MLVLLQGAPPAPSNIDLGWFLCLGHMELLHGLFCFWALHEAFKDRWFKHTCQRVLLEGSQCFKVALVPMALVAQHVVPLAVVAEISQGQRVIDLEHVVPRVPWVSALLTLVPFGRQDSVSVVLAVLLPLVLDQSQRYLMCVGRQSLASILAVLAHGCQLS